MTGSGHNNRILATDTDMAPKWRAQKWDTYRRVDPPG